MRNHSLQQRVATLEKQMAELLAQQPNQSKRKDWRRTVGMFTDDPDMQAIFAEAQRIREADRKKLGRAQAKTRRVPS